MSASNALDTTWRALSSRPAKSPARASSIDGGRHHDVGHLRADARLALVDHVEKRLLAIGEGAGDLLRPLDQRLVDLPGACLEVGPDEADRDGVGRRREAVGRDLQPELRFLPRWRQQGVLGPLLVDERGGRVGPPVPRGDVRARRRPARTTMPGRVPCRSRSTAAAPGRPLARSTSAVRHAGTASRSSQARAPRST